MSGADDQRVCGAGVDRPFRRAGNCYLHNRSLGECLPHTEGPAGAAFPARSVHSVVRLRCVLPFRHDDAVGFLHSGIDSPGPISAGRQAVPEKDGQRLSVSHCSVVLTNPGRVVADHRYFVCGDAVFVPRGADFDSDELRHVSFRAKPHCDTATHCRVLGGMSLWAAVWIVLIGVVLFLVIPRVGTGYFTRATTQSLLISGFTDSVQLGEIGQVKLSSAVVMHARQISGIPFAVLKWRGVALDRFDGHNWSRTDRKRRLLQPSLEGEFWLRPIEHQDDVAQYELLLEPLATNALFGPYQVRSVSGRLQAVEYDSDDSIYLRVPSARRTQYQVLSEIPKYKVEKKQSDRSG